MPKLWSQTIEAHRREVRETVLEATARLAAEHGLLNLTMSQVAQAAGIGRATLYKYFSNVEEVLHAWHARQVDAHLAQLTAIAGRDAPPIERLAAVLGAYTRLQRERTTHADQPHGRQLAGFLHRDDRLGPAGQRLRNLLVALLAAAVEDGQVRSDVATDELAEFCLHAANAAADAETDRAAQRLVTLILDGVRPRL
ncbi:MAG: TetR/AcrR family transcriptional regulator [Nitriliruptoraceae bacterium]